MNTRLVAVTGLVLSSGSLWPSFLPLSVAFEPRRTKTPPVSRQSDAELRRVQIFGHPRVSRYTGELTLDKAVEIALRQNPDILTAIQEIERTRGLIIEVRSQALPQLTMTGSYQEQDRRLLQGGGATRAFSSGTTGALPASLSTAGSSLPSNEVGNTNTTGNTVDTSGTSATGSGGTGLTTTTSTTRSSRGSARESRAVVPAPVGTTTGGAVAGAGTVATTDTANSGADILAGLQDLLSTNNNRTIQNKSWNITFQVQQAIYTGGQLTAAIKIAKFTQDSAYFQMRDIVDRVISDVREQFYLVLLNRSLITVAEEAVRLAGEQLQDQRNRFEAGTVPRFNVLRAEVELANVEPNLIKARNDYLLAQIQLSKSLGLDPGPGGKPEFNAVGELGITKRRLSLVDALALARARRPFLKVQRQTIMIDAEQIKVELAGYKPRIDVNAGYEFRNRSVSDDLSDVVNGWFFGATGSWDIFDGFLTYGRVKQARARLEQSKINYDDAVRQVELEVQTAYANLEQARQTVESQQKNVEQALEAVRLAQERFSAGAGTQLEILDARVALTRARTTELQARSDFNRDLAELDRATATDTKYDDSFRDPLAKVEKDIFGRLAHTGLPKLPNPTDGNLDAPPDLPPPGRGTRRTR